MSDGFDLAAAAHREMVARGFLPDIPEEAAEQAAALASTEQPAPNGELRDLRHLPWSSIDNDTSRDLDQVEVAERVDGGIRVLVGIAGVDARVAAGSPIDRYAGVETTTVYAGVRTFPMLPEALSTDLTSLVEGADRPALVLEYMVAPDGSLGAYAVYPALVRNRAQLTYNAVGPWLEGRGPVPAKLEAAGGLDAQLKLQDEAACALRRHRHRLGALQFDRLEAEPVMAGTEVRGIAARARNRAGELIEDFMVAANEVMASTLRERGVSSIRRVVRDPERWPRIVELAARYGADLPAQPDAAALNAFLDARREADGTHFADLSLAVLKLLGPGEYVLARPGEPQPGHFALAAHDYTHSTAPNRRFADLVTQRLVRAALAGAPPPYPDEELAAIARNCTLREDAARKVERAMTKRIAAVALAPRVGETFSAVVTGVTHKGVFVRVTDPPVEGRLMRGERGVDVGDRFPVKLLATDAERGYIDFGR